MSDIKTTFQQLLSARGLDLSERQWDQYEVYYRELVSWNEKMNLTAITDRDQVFIKHFYDSVSLSFFHPMNQVNNMADIGSGAGFPSIPLKIMFPHLQITIVDSLQKRIGFLQALLGELDVDEVSCIHGRAEEVARLPEHRDRYDLVTARAVARLHVLSEFCLPFVKPDGYFVAMKGSDPSEEVEETAFAWKELGGKFVSDDAFELPMEQSGRHFIKVKKIRSTPAKYPRKPGIPLKNPLLGKRS